MKHYLLALTLIICYFGSMEAQTPAFPGAEGHGRYTTGGRGGKIVHVTNLKDSGSGSFREAVKGNDKKIVVFDVGGVIALSKDVSIGANTTIEGQTAPAPGITLRYYTVSPAGNNIIMRFIRIRRGQEKNVNDGADASWCRHYTNLMLDHCSFSWSIDEVASFYDNNNFTMQWCTIGESLNNAGHGKGAHGYGGIWGGKLASFHHNMIAHVNNRSPRFNGARYNWTGYTGNTLYSQYKWKNAVQAENVDFRNCVVYNCGNGCYGGPGGGQVNMVNNYYKTGPAATTNRITQVTVGAEGNASGYPIYWDMTSRYYITGNTMHGNSGVTNNNWSGVIYDSGTFTDSNGDHWSKDPNHYNGSSVTYKAFNGTDCVRIRLDEPAPTDVITTHTAATAFDKVLAYAGASLCRDDVDERYAKEAREGTATYTGSVTKTKGRIDLVSDVNGYTEANFGTGSRESGFDTDKDGMPDAWEIANGLNPSDATDAKLFTLDTEKYYTNIEVYCNSLVQDIMLNGNADATDTPEEYYPQYTKEDGTVVEAIAKPGHSDPPAEEVSYILAQTTYESSPSTNVWNFTNGLVISNQKSKSYAEGKENGIKYSAGVQYTIELPENVSIAHIEITGYDNYAETDSYLSELNGVGYDATEYVFPQKTDGNYKVVTHSIDITPEAKGTLTFTPAGKQVVWIITLTGKKSSFSSIATQAATCKQHYYNLQGMRISRATKGLVIENTIQADGTIRSRKVFLK